MNKMAERKFPRFVDNSSVRIDFLGFLSTSKRWKRKRERKKVFSEVLNIPFDIDYRSLRFVIFL